MAKPIFIVRLPAMNYTDVEADDIKEKMAVQLSDYHILVVRSYIEDVKFECFNANNIEKLDLKDLKTKLK